MKRSVDHSELCPVCGLSFMVRDDEAVMLHFRFYSEICPNCWYHRDMWMLFVNNQILSYEIHLDECLDDLFDVLPDNLLDELFTGILL